MSFVTVFCSGYGKGSTRVTHESWRVVGVEVRNLDGLREGTKIKSQKM